MLPINNQPPAGVDLVVRLAGDLPTDIPLLADVRTLSNEGDPSGAAREFRIEDLRVGEVWVRGHRLVGFDEFMTSAQDACSPRSVGGPMSEALAEERVRRFADA